MTFQIFIWIFNKNHLDLECYCATFDLSGNYVGRNLSIYPDAIYCPRMHEKLWSRNPKQGKTAVILWVYKSISPQTIIRWILFCEKFRCPNWAKSRLSFKLKLSFDFATSWKFRWNSDRKDHFHFQFPNSVSTTFTLFSHTALFGSLQDTIW